MNATRMTLALSLLILMSFGSSTASDQVPAKSQDHPIAIAGATIHPVGAPLIDKGTILFDRGKIVAIGKTVQLPDSCNVIEASGKHVYPGLISADTELGLTEIGAVRASNDMTETGRINPNVRAETAVNPESDLFPVARANGITLAVCAPRGGLISGTSAMLMMDGWTWEDMTFKAPAALYVNWPRMSIERDPSMRKSEEEQKKTRDLALRELADAFRDARAYFTAKTAEAQDGVPYHNIDVRWEAVIPILERKVPVVVWADEIQQIEAAVAWGERENIRIIIGGGKDAWRVTDLLRRKKIPVLCGGILSLPMRRFEEYDAAYVLPKQMYDAGIPFAIITRGEAPHERNLPYHAAMAAAFGLPKEVALRAITLSPAEIFGVADRAGSLEVGKDATLIVTTGDPLEVSSNVVMEFIQGRKIDLSTRHTRLYEKYTEKYRRTKAR